MTEYEYESLRLMVEGSSPPLSPHMLLQEMVASSWQCAAAAVLCNRTDRRQSHPTAWAMFLRWPRPESMAFASRASVAGLIRPCGLHNRRAEYLVTMSRQWLMGVRPWPPDHDGFTSMGSGEYARDSYRMFVLRDLRCGPNDGPLMDFLAWAYPRRLQGLPWARRLEDR